MADFAIVFLPGIMGSELTHQGNLIWPGKFPELLGRYGRMREMLSTSAVEGKIIRYYGPKPVYGRILEYLNTRLPNRVYECPYDWRRPNEASAGKLAEVISKAALAHAQIVLVTHSMGGLVARFYLESGRFNSSPGYRQVSTLITLATPHCGSPMALGAALGYEKVEFLHEDQVYELASKTDFPSLYQLLPPPGCPFVWKISSGLPLVDIYDPKIVRYFAGDGDRPLTPNNMEAATRFQSALHRKDDVRYVSFLSTQHGMNSTLWAVEDKGHLRIFSPGELACSGDGTVPGWSARMDRTQAIAVGGNHTSLLGDSLLQKELGRLLGIDASQAPLIAQPVSLSVREGIVKTSEPVNVSVRFTYTDPIVDGSVHIEPRAGYSLRRAPVIQAPVEMPLARTTCLDMTLKAPNVPSIYRVSWYEKGTALATDDLIVQASEPLAEQDIRELQAGAATA